MPSLSYAAVTPARNEASNLRRLAESMRAQTAPPSQWLIVDNGSSDGTAELVAELVAELPFASAIRLPAAPGNAIRGGPIVAAFETGLAALRPDTDIVVKLDADVSFEPDFFELLLAAFEADPRLGIAGGVCYEQAPDGAWLPTFTTRDHVRGATRAYRRSCLGQVLPLERRMGWDGIDELRAQVAGWRTRTIDGLPFLHHRALGARERSWSKWVAQGDMAHYMGYRFSYLLLRAGYRSLREPSATGMIWGFLTDVARRTPRYPDPAVRRHLREQQSLLALPRRVREALGRTGAAG
jgi:glycosyltransferase involved in cell wall biosynthesis